MRYTKSVFLFLIFVLLSPPVNITAQTSWNIKQMYSVEGKAPVHSLPDRFADTTGFTYYLDKVLILVNEPKNLYGWSEIIYPVKGYVDDKFLISPKEKQMLDERFNNVPGDNEYSKWDWELKECSSQIAIIKKSPDETSEIIGSVRKGESVLLIYDGTNKLNDWKKISYPLNGYINCSDLSEQDGNWTLAFGGSLSPVFIPYEKNFKKKGIPFGGFVDISKTNWNLNFRLGYNYLTSTLSEYLLHTQFIYLQIQYNYLKLFDDHLSMYAFAGAGIWFCDFQFTKYPQMSSYFKKETDSGLGYIGGGGIKYILYGFFIDLQYQYLQTNLAKFGEQPKQGQFTNYYELYPGGSQMKVYLGYKLIF